MTATAADYVKSASAALAGEELLRAPVSVLLGVSEAAASALEHIHIRTVFDLAASDVFAIAATIAALETDPTLAEARLNAVAADAVIAPPGVPASELARQSIAILKGIGQAAAAELSVALDAQAVRDLAWWAPYRAARAILAATFFPDADDIDVDAAGDLLPKSGVYPTERVFYRKLLIDVAPPASGATALEDAGAIDLGAALAAPVAFDRLATGALVTFSQSWFSQGLTLGQLLHSTSLAPGESTRIAMIDWTRRSREGTAERISESEQLANTTTHNRALSEVTNATATEFQQGVSNTQVTSTTEQAGVALGLEIGPFAIGGGGGVSQTSTEAMSASSSFGARDMAASLAQNINDRSHQNASSARNRRASIVREVSQEEHETISTRVLTNYNHMHALTVQYYEVVQAFRVTTELARAERCLFVPLKLVNFRDQTVVDRLRPILAAAALTAAARRQLTSEYGVVEVIPQTPPVFAGHLAIFERATLGVALGPSAGSPVRRAIGGVVGGRIAASADSGGLRSEPAAEFEPVRGLADAGSARGLVDDYGLANTPTAILTVKGWNIDQVNRLGTFGGRVPVRLGSDSVFVPDEALLLGVSLREGQATKFAVRRRDNGRTTFVEISATNAVLGAPVALGDLQAIAVQNAAGAELKTSLVLHLNLNGTLVPLDVPVTLQVGGANAQLHDVVRFSSVRAANALVEHLEANRLHYSRAVFRTLDAATIGGLLGRFSYRGIPLARVVEPQPFAVTANFLVFRMNVPLDARDDDASWGAEQDAWRDFLASRGLDKPVPQTEVVPLPSGGVFAEAVLGRFNSAEKIDLKRFWNWQDSPIPEVATEIAAIKAGSRAEAEGLVPGQLGAPVVSIQAPTALPGAAGVAPILAAIQSSPFRDMSGVAQTAALAQAAAQASGAGASAAGAQAAKNLFNVLNQNTQRMKIAADLIGSLYGAGGAAGGGGGDGKAAAGRGTPSARGAALGAAEALDEQTAAAGAGGAAGAAGAGAADSAGGGGSAGAVSGTSTGAPGAAPTTVTGQVLRAQSGTDLTEAAEQVVDEATKPSAPPPAAKRQTPAARKTIPKPATRSPQTYRLTFVLQATEGATIKGWQAQGADRETTLFDSPLLQDRRHTIEITTAAASILVAIKALSEPHGWPMEGTKEVVLQTADEVMSILADEQSDEVILNVRPILKEEKFEMPLLQLPNPVPAGLPDFVALEQKLLNLGITPQRRHRIPIPEFVPPDKWFATVTYLEGRLLIKQIR